MQQIPLADWENQGILQAKQANYREAVSDFTPAILARPAVVRTSIVPARISTWARRKKPLRIIRRLFAIYKPDSGLALHDRALCELRVNPLEEAARDFDDVLKLQLDNPRTWNGRGAIYLKQRQCQQAVDYFGKAIQLDPNFITAYKNRAAAEKPPETSAARQRTWLKPKR